MTRKGWLLFIAISVFWGIPYMFIKIAVRELDPAVLALVGFAKSERVTGLQLVGLLVGMGGLVVLLGFDVGGHGQQLLGVIFVLLATAGYAVGALLLKHSSLAQVPRIGVAATECI